jgi:hypothetical protein
VKPTRSLLDPSFQYVPAVATSVADSWRRFGWRPMTKAERSGRRSPEAILVVDRIMAVEPANPLIRARHVSPLIAPAEVGTRLAQTSYFLSQP